MIALSMRVAGFGLTLIAAALGLGSQAASAATGLAVTGQATMAPPATLKTVTYLGYAFSVPASWPVIRTARTSTTCVRFDRHAIYLGDPGQNQACPSSLLGTTEAMLVQPAPGQAASAAEDVTARRITVLSPGIEVTATYDTNRALLTQILASASLPVPATSPSTAAATMAPASTGPGPSVNAAQALLTPTAATAVPASATRYAGEGFDACTAPSSAYMSAWKSASPYGAVGVYIGGADRACAQPNLTASWVSQQAALGWHFLPTYVGVQAALGQITSPASQGVAAAQDAVTQAAALGFGPGTPVYYDMEAYPSAQASNALGFLSAWTTQLHVDGYRSGVYSSSSSGITDLAGNLLRYAMPDLVWDALWNSDASTADPAIPSTDWSSHQRAHQYNGGVNAAYGGDTLNIDQDYLDIAVSPLPADPAQRTLVTRGGTVGDFVIRGDHNLYAYDQASFGGSFQSPQKLTTAGNLSGTAAAVQAPGGAISVYARTTGGSVTAIGQSTPGGSFSTSANLGGSITGSPAAIITQNGTVALYATGTNGQLYTWTQASPGGSFTGPARLTANGGLTGSPVAALNGSGVISVFDRTGGGAIRAKWQSTPGGSFSNSANLGGSIAGGLAALDACNDTVTLYASGADGREYADRQSIPGGAYLGWAVI